MSDKPMTTNTDTKGALWGAEVAAELERLAECEGGFRGGSERAAETMRAAAKMIRLSALTASEDRAEPVAWLRSLGCKCAQPLIGYRPDTGPRCRLCNASPDTSSKAGSGDLHWAVYTAAYAILRDYDNHPSKDRGLIQAGDQRIPSLIADQVVAKMAALSVQTAPVEGKAGEVAKLFSDIMFLRKDNPGQSEQFYAEEAAAIARKGLRLTGGGK